MMRIWSSRESIRIDRYLKYQPINGIACVSDVPLTPSIKQAIIRLERGLLVRDDDYQFPTLSASTRQQGRVQQTTRIMTPKAISNKMKSKGLQRLRWWCEMCEKQCRDENGFKCHATSEVHLRNMQLYAANPAHFKEKFSNEFKSNFVKDLSSRHHTNSVSATSFYSEYISQKDHVHMNSTKWRALTEFILDLAREGIVKAEETEKGWYIQWIDRSAVPSDAEKKMQREKLQLDDAERDRQRTMAQMKAAKQSGAMSTHAAATELMRNEGDGELGFSLPDESPANSNSTKRPLENPFGQEDDNEDEEDEKNKFQMPKKPLSAMEEIAMRETERRKRLKATEEAGAPAATSSDAWLMKNIVVKVMNKKLSGGEYYKKKGIVFEIHNGGLMGDVEMLDSRDCLRLGATQLETVLPNPGGRVRILQGAKRGHEAVLKRLNIEKYSADVTLDNGTLLTLPYESICKIGSK